MISAHGNVSKRFGRQAASNPCMERSKSDRYLMYSPARMRVRVRSFDGYSTSCALQFSVERPAISNDRTELRAQGVTHVVICCVSSTRACTTEARSSCAPWIGRRDGKLVCASFGVKQRPGPRDQKALPIRNEICGASVAPSVQTSALHPTLYHERLT
jgi:hypothetical protein